MPLEYQSSPLRCRPFEASTKVCAAGEAEGALSWMTAGAKSGTGCASARSFASFDFSGHSLCAAAGTRAAAPCLPAGEPHERVEPVHGRRDLRDEQGDPVRAADVSELVEKHDAAALGLPLPRSFVDEQQRVANPRGHRDGHFAAREEAD